jgi:hypothetical protein
LPSSSFLVLPLFVPQPLLKPPLVRKKSLVKR